MACRLHISVADLNHEQDTCADDNDAAAQPTLSMASIHTRSGARSIPQHGIFKLKTRGAHKKDQDQVADHLPRMWTAQTPFFILAFHEYGLFTPEDITVQDVRGDVAL